MPNALLRLPCLAFALVMAVMVAFPAAAQFQAPATAPAEEAGDRPGYQALADILEDETARNALIADLRRMAQDEAVVADPPAEDTSIARQIARTTHGIAESIVAEAGEAYERIVNFDRRSVTSEGVRDLAQAAIDLGVVIVVVIAVLWIARLLAGNVYKRMSNWVLTHSGERPWLKRGLAAIGCSLIDIVIVFLGWVVGYAVALFVLGGETGTMDTRQSLFLNAFLVIELTKVVIRLFFATRYDGLRILPIRGEDAAYWNTWLSRMTSFIGYGVLVAVPIVAFNLGAAVGNVVAAIVYGIALIMVIILIRQNREPVSQRLSAWSERSRIGFAKMILATFARIWHIVAIAYFTLLAIMLVVHPETAMSFIIAATVQTIVAILGGVLLSTLIDKAIALGVRLNPNTKQQFPMLEERLNAFVPTTLKVVRIVITIVVAALILDAWQAFDFFAWLASDRGLNLVGTLMSIAFILFISVAVWMLVSSWIESRINAQEGGPRRLPTARERTLLTIFRNAFTIALVVIVSMITLSELGLDIGPLLAGAGVLGLAIGFGAQKLVQDVITGVFIQLENAMNTGDVVTAGGTTGVVEKLTVRSVGIRDLSGTYHLIPFSSVDTVSNFMRGFGYHVGDYGVAYRENVDDVIEVLKAAFEELRAIPEQQASIIDDLEVHGVTEFADSSVNVRVRIKTLPGMQWAIGRAFNGLVKKHFDAAGIEIPFPHVTLYFGEDKKGDAPPAPIRIIQAPSAVEDKREDDGADGRTQAPSRKKRTARPKEQPQGDRASEAGTTPDIPSEDDV